MKATHTTKKSLFFPLLCALCAVVLLVCSLFLGPSTAIGNPRSQLRITELMNDNRSVYADEDGNYYDWVEITNTGTITADLTGICLSDNPENKTAYSFDTQRLEAGESVVVFLSEDKKESRPLHASFALDADGDTVYLYDTDESLLDTLSIGAGGVNLSYGIQEDNTPVWFAVPTPNQPNRGISADTLEELEQTAFTGVLINEVCAVSRDSDIHFPCDWVELYNTSGQSVSLSGYRLCTGYGGATYEFPEIEIKPHAFFVLSCDEKSKQPSVAPFSLSPYGETLLLYAPDGSLCDRFESGKQRYGITSGRIMGDRHTRAYFTTSTKDSQNSTSLSGYAPVPIINCHGGYVKPGTVISITTPADCRVYYTTDGSYPTNQSHAYQGEPLIIHDNTVLRTVAYRDGYLPSDVATETFLTASPHSLPIISVSTAPDLLFGENGAMTNYQDETLEPTVHTEYFTAQGEKQLAFDSLFRISGGFSRRNVQKAFSLNLNQTVGVTSISYPFFSDSNVTTFENLLLRPSGSDWSESKLRDEFCANAIKEIDGQLVQSAQPVALYINGTYWGLYYLREKRNEAFVSAYTAIPKEDVQEANHPALADTNETLDADLAALIEYATQHDLRDSAAYRYVLSQIDEQSLMHYYAIETFFGNGDNINNIYAYRDRRGGEWKWVVYDMDWACTSYYANRNFLEQLYQGTAAPSYQNYHYPLMTALLQNEEFRYNFIRAYVELMDTALSAQRLLPILTALSEDIAEEIPRQYERWGAPAPTDWDNQIRYITQFLETRKSVITEQLKSTFSITEAEWKNFTA